MPVLSRRLHRRFPLRVVFHRLLGLGHRSGILGMGRAGGGKTAKQRERNEKMAGNPHPVFLFDCAANTWPIIPFLRDLHIGKIPDTRILVVRG